MKTVIIDVRTPKEFSDGSYPGALNIPSGDFNVSEFRQFEEDHIALVCFSGNRASRVKSLLELEGFSNISLMQNQMVHLGDGSSADSKIWTVDRQFRLALAIILGVFLVGNYIFHSTFSLGLLLIVFSGLMYSALSDNCYLKEFITWLPWNRKVNL